MVKVKVLSEFKHRVRDLLVAAFGFVAALQWNSAIQEWFRPLTEKGRGAVAMTGVAVAVTLIAVIIVYIVGLFLKEEEK